MEPDYPQYINAGRADYVESRAWVRGSQEVWIVCRLTVLLLSNSYGTPFLLSLGLTEQLTSLVWLAGPISGLVAQPVIGV